MDEKLTVSFCLREIAKNIEEGHYGIKLGWSGLYFEDVDLDAISTSKNVYKVIDWNDNTYMFNDLFAAINKFIEVNRNPHKY